MDLDELIRGISDEAMQKFLIKATTAFQELDEHIPIPEDVSEQWNATLRRIVDVLSLK